MRLATILLLRCLAENHGNEMRTMTISGKPEDISLDAIIDEVLDQLREGKSPTLSDLVSRFPEHATEIGDVFPAMILAEQIKRDSLAGSSSLKSPPPIRTTEHHLLLGVLALQFGLINRAQFLDSFEKWNSDRSRSYQSILLADGLIKNEACELLNRLVEQQLSGMMLTGGDLAGDDANGQTYVFTGSTKSRVHDRETGFSLSENAVLSNRFEFIRPLDQGGLGIVSVALDKELNREVALKEIREDRANDTLLREKFWLEAQLTGGLEHPGIVPIYGLGKSATGKLYYAMRLIKGNNLQLHIKNFHDKVKQGDMEFDGQSLRRILRRFLDVCEAISYAHSRGVLHRDLKPGNVMLGPYGETLVVDWGLAKAMGVSSPQEMSSSADVSVLAQPESPIRPSGSKSDSTRDGSIVGTPSYAPPEQLSGHLDLIEVRSDVYGLGAILYEILSGQAPASGKLLDVIRTVTTGKVLPARDINPQAPIALNAICRKAMALAPCDRYESASELRSDIERWLDDSPVKAYPEPIWLRSRRWMRKHPAVVSTLSAIAIMLVAGTAFVATIVSRNNLQLGQLNLELKDAILQETRSTELANEQRLLAQSQSQLALATLNSVLLDVQASLRNLPGGSTVRRAIITSSLKSLDKVVMEVSDKSLPDRNTMLALLELADVAVRLGTGNPNGGIGKPDADRNSASRYNTPESQSAAGIASTSLAKALEIGKQLYQLEKSAEIGNDLYRIYFALAYNKRSIGNSDEAVRYFEEALSIGNETVAAHPENTYFRSSVAVTKVALADLLRTSKRVDLAKKWIMEALAETKALTELEPNSDRYREFLAQSLECLGDVESDSDELNEADEHFLQSIAIREQFLEEDKTNLGKIKAAIFVLGKRGVNLLKLGKLSLAAEVEENVVQLHLEIQRLDPLDNQSRVELANSLERRAKISARMGSSDEEIDFHHQAMAIRKRMLEEDPTNALRKRAYSISFDNLGKAELKRGNMNVAKELLEKSLAMSRELVETDPKNTTKRKDVGLSLASVGNVLLKQGKLSEAQELFKESLSIFEVLANEEIENASKQRDLMIGRARLADVLLFDDKLDEALALYQQSVESVRDRVSKNPDNQEAKADLGVLLQNVAAVHLKLARPADAILNLEECVALRSKICEIDSDNVRSKMDLGIGGLELGKALKQAGRLDEATTALARSIEILSPICDQDPNNLDAVFNLADAQASLGELLFLKENVERSLELLAASRSSLDQLLAETPDNVDWRTKWTEVSTLLEKVESQSGKKDTQSRRIP